MVGSVVGNFTKLGSPKDTGKTNVQDKLDNSTEIAFKEIINPNTASLSGMTGLSNTYKEIVKPFSWADFFLPTRKCIISREP